MQVRWGYKMKEDLLKLKKELELARKKELELKGKKYVPIDIEGDFADDNFEGKTISEIDQLENTDGFIKQFEDFAKDIIRGLVATDMPFDVLCFCSFPYFLCDKDCIEKIRKIDHTGDYEKCAELVISNSYLRYVPIGFDFLAGCSGSYNKDGSLWDLDDGLKEINPDCYNKINEFEKKRIFAIVDFDKFIRKMEDIGYTVKFGGKPCKSTLDYISQVRNNPEDMSVVININFNPEKSKDVKLKR